MNIDLLMLTTDDDTLRDLRDACDLELAKRAQPTAPMRPASLTVPANLPTGKFAPHCFDKPTVVYKTHVTCAERPPSAADIDAVLGILEGDSLYDDELAGTVCEPLTVATPQRLCYEADAAESWADWFTDDSQFDGIQWEDLGEPF